MTSELTESELKLADKLITNLQKSGKSWRWFRWFGLVMGIALISLAVYEWWFLYDRLIRGIGSYWPLGSNTVSPTEIEAYVDFRLMFLRLEFGLYIGVIVMGVLGGVFLAFSLTNWGRYRRDLLVAKLLRGEFERRTRITS